MRELVVKGIGKATVTPDIVVLYMSLKVTEPEYEKSMRSGAEMLDNLRTAVVSVGHGGKDLKSTSFNIDATYENYKENDEWKKRFAGYTCSYGLKLEFDLDMHMLGATLGAIAGCDSDPTLDIKFSIKNPDEVSRELLESAVENAKQKAVILAKSAGVTLGTIQRIEYNWNEHHLYSGTNVLLGSFDTVNESPRSMPMDIEPEEIDFRDTAMIVWEIK